MIDSQNFLRYKSAKQVNIETGSLMKNYINTLNNLFSLHSTELPNIPYEDWLNFAHINGKTNTTKINNTFFYYKFTEQHRSNTHLIMLINFQILNFL